MIRVVKAENHGTVCPTQWSGVTEDGEEVYARYRWGTLTVMVGDESVFYDRLGDPLDGSLDYAKLKHATAGEIAWPDAEDQL